MLEMETKQHWKMLRFWDLYARSVFNTHCLQAKAEEYQAKETQAIKLSEEPCGELSFEEEWNAGNPNSK